MSVLVSESPKNQESTWYNPVRETTCRRHQMVIAMHNKISNERIAGKRPHPQDVLEEVSNRTGYAVKTIENIISRNRQG